MQFLFECLNLGKAFAIIYCLEMALTTATSKSCNDNYTDSCNDCCNASHHDTREIALSG